MGGFVWSDKNKPSWKFYNYAPERVLNLRLYHKIKTIMFTYAHPSHILLSQPRERREGRRYSVNLDASPDGRPLCPQCFHPYFALDMINIWFIYEIWSLTKLLSGFIKKIAFIQTGLTGSTGFSHPVFLIYFIRRKYNGI